jgi:hypothetical protein
MPGPFIAFTSIHPKPWPHDDVDDDDDDRPGIGVHDSAGIATFATPMLRWVIDGAITSYSAVRAARAGTSGASPAEKHVHFDREQPMLPYPLGRFVVAPSFARQHPPQMDSDSGYAASERVR